MIEQRNDYGFPIVDRFEQARAYAAAARERNKPACPCATCREKELLPAVIQLTERWVRNG